MKKTIYSLVVLLFASAALFSQEISFIDNNMDKAFEKARFEKKPVFVDAYATWCGPCKWMVANVFNVDSVAEFYNSNFICLKIDVDTDEGAKFQKKYPVAAMPTFFFINPDGKVIKKVVGGMDPEKFYTLGKDVKFPEQSNAYIMGQKYKSGNREKTFLAEYAMEIADDDSLAQIIATEYFKDLPVSAIDSAEGFALFSLWKTSLNSEYSKYFAGKYDDFLLYYGRYAQNKLNSIIMAEIETAALMKNKSGLDALYKFLQPVYSDDQTGFDELKVLIEQAYEQQISR